jgi:hypothetical protein
MSEAMGILTQWAVRSEWFYELFVASKEELKISYGKRDAHKFTV